MKEGIIAQYNLKCSKNPVFLEKRYKNSGVWALWGENTEGNKVCLEVAQTENIFSEISSALYILFTEDDLACKNCACTYVAR